MNKITTMVPAYGFALRKAAVIYSSNDETTECMANRIGNSNGMIDKLRQLTELCVDDKYLEERADINKSENEIIHIIVSGRLIYRKGIQVLVESIPYMSTEKSFVVDIYGEGDQRKILEESVKDNDIADRVVFHGKVAFDEMQECYKNADIYVLPSLRESTGTAVFEAMANKLPVVTFDQNGAKHVVGHDAGILVPLQSKEQVVHDLAAALSCLVDDLSFRKKLGQRGFEKLKEKYTWSQRAREMSLLYQQLTEERSQ